MCRLPSVLAHDLVHALAPHHFYAGVAVGLFGFALIWPCYPATGDGFEFIGLLVALDDEIEHMTPYSTPLDQVWKFSVYPLLK
ncbi:hypothetical protein EXE43_08890 [Halorubrum sp. SS5]|nr:hypothetical protein EXE43_08890 [Halorubrum sp. SS5]